MIKQEKEYDVNRIQTIHDMIDSFKNPDVMNDKIKSDKFDLKDEPYATEDDVLSTELSDLGDLDIYRKYKLVKHEDQVTRQ